MKGFGLTLLVINIALAVWWIAADPEAATDTPRQLLTPAVQSCYTVQVYHADELSELSAAVAKLGGAISVTEFDQWVDGSKWWVVSAQNSSNTLADYQTAISGAFEVETGPKKGQFSLGIFSSQDNAARQQRELANIGLDSEMLLYQLRAPAWRVIVSAPQVEWLINSYQLEFIEKKSC